MKSLENISRRAEGAGFVWSPEEQAQGMPYHSYSSLKGRCQMGAVLSYGVCRTTGIQRGKVQITFLQFFSPIRVVRHWNRLCRRWWSYLEVFRRCSDLMLGDGSVVWRLQWCWVDGWTELS